MSRRGLVALAGFGSVLLLGGALAFQFIGGLAPCPMCIWQRWPHVVAILAASAAVAFGLPVWAVAFGAGAMLVSAGLGFFHAGVERGWWEGPMTCSAGPVEGLSTDALLDQIMSAPLVRCDEIVWQFLGLSMAGWNALISLGLAALWLAAFRAR